MNELALFAGAGGGILGGYLLGWKTVCAVEIGDYPRRVLLARQRDGILPAFPIWDDITTFDGKPWKGRVDLITGGFPCQDISAAGKGAGIEGERSQLWREMARVVREVRPRFVFVENSPMLTSRGLGVVLGDLAAMGYDAEWGVLGAVDAGAPHKRERIWIVADCYGERQLQPQGLEREERGRLGHCGAPVADAAMSDDQAGSSAAWHRQRAQGQPRGGGGGAPVADAGCLEGQGLRGELGHAGETRQGRAPSTPDAEQWWRRDPADGEGGAEPSMGRVANGVAHRVDRLRCIGNGQVPAVAALAWTILSEGIE